MKYLVPVLAGLGLIIALQSCSPRQPQGLIGSPHTQFTNSAPCYSNLCPTNCPNRSRGIACSTSGNGSLCSPSSVCRGIILDK